MTMKRLFLAAIALTSLTANATQSYSFLSGGYQFTRVAENGMGQYFADKYNNSDDSKYLHGLYFRGSWNFYDHFFAEYRTGATTRSSSTLAQDYLALGYYIPLAAKTSVYASMGYSGYSAERDINAGCGLLDNDKECKKRSFSQDGSGLSAELGLRFKPLRWLQIEPSYRYADFGSKGQHELRLTNLIEFTQHSALELNAGYRHWDNLDETNYQVGYRYSF